MMHTLQPGCKIHTSVDRGLLSAFQRCSISPHTRRQPLSVQGESSLRLAMLVHHETIYQKLDLRPTARAASGRTCELTGKTANNGYNVTFSHKRNKKLQHPNLQHKSIYWPEGERLVKMKLCTKVGRHTGDFAATLYFVLHTLKVAGTKGDRSLLITAYTMMCIQHPQTCLTCRH